MPVVQYWSCLEEAWEATDNCPLVSSDEAIQSSPKSNSDWKLIKNESRVRVILLEPAAPHAPVICKIYRTPWHLAWRTIGMVSRANREFTALMEAHRHGLPVVCPRYWMETRIIGGLLFSAIILEAITRNNLEQLLKNKDLTKLERMWLARETGVLLGELHRGGLYWATARPRNILLQQGINAKMLAIDMPYACWHGHDLTGSDSALIDVLGMLRCKNEDWQFNQKERMEFFLGYCADDVGKASELEPLAVSHSTRQSKLERFKGRFTNVLFSSPRSPGRGGIYHSSDASYQLRDSQAISVD